MLGETTADVTTMKRSQVPKYEVLKATIVDDA